MAVPKNHVSRWVEEGGHACPQLLAWLADATYDILEQKNAPRGRRRGRRYPRRRRAQRQLVCVPNVVSAHPIADRVDFCPACGAEVHVIRLPAREPVPAREVVIPDVLPEHL